MAQHKEGVIEANEAVMARLKAAGIRVKMDASDNSPGWKFAEYEMKGVPLRLEGLSAGRAFLYGSASGVVEPVFGILVVLVAGTIQPLMPWLLSFAAGAMMYVVVEELIPEAHLGEHSNTGTLGVMAGFLLMMVLDVALG